MPLWMLNLYVLVTSRVPFPRGSVLFAIVTMTFFTLLAPWHAGLARLGLPHPAILAMMCGFLVNTSKLMPRLISDPDDRLWQVGAVFVVTLGICALLLFAPDLVWVQHSLSGFAVLSALLFVMLYNGQDGPNSFVWVGRNWKRGQRNAANWVIAERCAWILINESLIRYAAVEEWLVGIVLANIALHYLMHWTILATHPYEEKEPDQTP